MDGSITKYHYYDTTKQSTITIPVKIAKSLNWGNKDDIVILTKHIDGKTGIFLFKKED